MFNESGPDSKHYGRDVWEMAQNDDPNDPGDAGLPANPGIPGLEG